MNLFDEPDVLISDDVMTDGVMIRMPCVSFVVPILSYLWALHSNVVNTKVIPYTNGSGLTVL